MSHRPLTLKMAEQWLASEDPILFLCDEVCDYSLNTWQELWDNDEPHWMEEEFKEIEKKFEGY